MGWVRPEPRIEDSDERQREGHAVARGAGLALRAWFSRPRGRILQTCLNTFHDSEIKTPRRLIKDTCTGGTHCSTSVEVRKALRWMGLGRHRESKTATSAHAKVMLLRAALGSH